MEERYLPRIADPVIDGLMAEVPAVLLVGPRAAGKTTTAARHAASVVRLDRPAEAAQFQADPDVALARFREPVLLDEWQTAPGVLGAVKRAVDASFRPGRFIVTGSVRDDLLADSWPITGRLVRVEIGGLTVREIDRAPLRREPFLGALAEHGVDALESPTDPPNLAGYVELAVRGGYPEPALTLRQPRRAQWMRSYVEQLLTRDAADVDVPRDPVRLQRFFEAYALNTAGEVTERTLHESAGINRKTAEAYERLLRMLFLVDPVPAWSTNRLKRLVRAPKRYIRDPGLAAAVLRAGIDDVLRDGSLLGRIIDTFVVAQLRAEQLIYDAPPGLFHLRQEGGAREIDIVAELSYRSVVGLEIKASAAPERSDARHLIWLRDELGDAFRAGVVLHTGRHVYRLDDRIVAAPIACLWG